MQIVGRIAAARDHASMQSLLCTSNELRRMASESIHAAVMTGGPGGSLAHFPRMAVASKLRVKGMAAGAVTTALLAASSSSPNRLLAVNDFDFEAAAGDHTPLDATLPAALAAACPRLERLAAEVGMVGKDVVEVSPPYDSGNSITALFAHRCVLEAITGTAMRSAARLATR